MKPKVLANAQFTEDMVETLKDYFDQYAVGGVVTIEVTDHGLWFANPDGTRQFLGSAERFPDGSARFRLS